MYVYSDPARESDPHALPDVEVFDAGDYPQEDGPLEPGYYYWFCSPGTPPDSEPIGPFASEDAALQHCRRDLA